MLPDKVPDFVWRAREEAQRTMDYLARSGTLAAIVEAAEITAEQQRRLYEQLHPTLEMVEVLRPQIELALEGVRPVLENIAKLTGGLAVQDFPALPASYYSADSGVRYLPAPTTEDDVVEEANEVDEEIEELRARVQRLEAEQYELRVTLAFESVEYPQLPPEFFGKN